MNLEQRLDAFLASEEQQRAWLIYRGMEVYVRKSVRLLAGRRYEDVLDLASASNSEAQRGRGTYGRFVDHCMTLGRPLFVENVMNDRLVEFYKRRGFEVKADDHPRWSVSLYWLPKPEGVIK